MRTNFFELSLNSLLRSSSAGISVLSTFVFVTIWELKKLDAICYRIAIIDHGKNVVIGNPTELKDSLGGDIITLKYSKRRRHLISKIEHYKEVKKENDS
jgi:ABC-2 type transport system ATP-binding protein